MIFTTFQRRTLSTVVLGPLLLWAIVSLQGEQFSLLLALLLLPAAWEWGRLAGQVATRQELSMHCCWLPSSI